MGRCDEKRGWHQWREPRSPLHLSTPFILWPICSIIEWRKQRRLWATHGDGRAEVQADVVVPDVQVRRAPAGSPDADPHLTGAGVSVPNGFQREVTRTRSFRDESLHAVILLATGDGGLSQRPPEEKHTVPPTKGPGRP